ncbi:cache domain-containing sensor histidine kinase [Paenibacillus turpanensis]|uniref:cache domain-containing sensor histidine kinase n=1 Tax=Paenibacillus turpanensis TaxID=2689078 RepID=UPI00140AE358|nr:sensor histidine kinase [Paenibacillus turpanensis]
MRLKTYYGNQMIKNKIFMLTLLIMAAVSGISVIAVHFATELYEEKVYDESAEVLNLSSTSVDNELRRIERLSFQILSDPKIQEIMTTLKEGDGDYQMYRMRDELMLQLLTLAQQEKYISSIQMIDANDQEHTVTLVDKNRGDIQMITEHALKGAGANVWFAADDPNVLITAKQVRKVRNLSLAHLGVLIIYVDMNRLIDQTLDLSEDKMFMIEYDGRAVLSTHEVLPAGKLTHIPISGRKGYEVLSLEGRTYFVTHLTSTFQDFTYYNVISYDHIFQQSRLIKNGLIALYALLFVAALFLGWKASQSITRPLEYLIQKMKQVQKGNFNTDELFQENNLNMDETGQIHRNFRLMLEKINELILENYAKQLAIKESEYKALQAQINPHFLYNTLESINWMAKVSRQEHISRTVEALGSLLRSIIGKKEPLIPISEEMEIVGNYITVQQARFAERIQFQQAEELNLISYYYIPKLTIQPVVENVIHHVVETISGPCIIRLGVQAEEEHIEIAVHDNGPGMDQETLEAVRSGAAKPKGTGIGLKNINERIQLLFGAAYGVTIDSEPGAGTTVTIRIPYRLEGDHV